MSPAPGDPELEDTDIPFPIEPPHVTALRNADGGPYYLAPDSTEPVPPEIWDGLDADSVVEQARQADAESPNTNQSSLLSLNDRRFLRTRGPAALKLLETLERGLEATTQELDEAVEARLREAGLD